MLFAGKRSARARVPGRASPLRGRTSSATLEAGRAPGAAARRNGSQQRHAETLALLRDAVRYRIELLRGRVPLRYERIVVRAEDHERVESCRSRRRRRRVARRSRQPRRPSRSTRSASATASSRRSSCSGSRGASFATTRTSAARSPSSTAGSGRPSRACSRPATEPGVRGSYVGRGPGPARRRVGLVEDEARAAPIRRRLERTAPLPASARPHVPVGPGIYELDDARHGRLPLRGSRARRARRGRSTRRPTSTSSRPSPARRWASARGATASGRSPR